MHPSLCRAVLWHDEPAASSCGIACGQPLYCFSSSPLLLLSSFLILPIFLLLFSFFVIFIFARFCFPSLSFCLSFPLVFPAF